MRCHNQPPVPSAGQSRARPRGGRSGHRGRGKPDGGCKASGGLAAVRLLERLAGRRRAVSKRPCHGALAGKGAVRAAAARRSEEHTSELQSLMRISYAVFCLKKKNKK